MRETDVPKDVKLFEDTKAESSTTESVDAETHDYICKFLDISNNAKESDQKDKAMSLGEALKTFAKAAMWSVVLSSAMIMEGYDVALLNAFYTFPSFTKKFGKEKILVKKDTRFPQNGKPHCRVS